MRNELKKMDRAARRAYGRTEDQQAQTAIILTVLDGLRQFPQVDTRAMLAAIPHGDLSFSAKPVAQAFTLASHMRQARELLGEAPAPSQLFAASNQLLLVKETCEKYQITLDGFQELWNKLSSLASDAVALFCTQTSIPTGATSAFIQLCALVRALDLPAQVAAIDKIGDALILAHLPSTLDGDFTVVRSINHALGRDIKATEKQLRPRATPAPVHHAVPTRPATPVAAPEQQAVHPPSISQQLRGDTSYYYPE
ncbi:hypothetical protein [Rugamonas aquatica]|uniref:Uncharacterized protein n=1 Tax=Rugamonas aquatica TaxID=2743357 RepID=A0A6A7N6K8_9BURK|nr:hypothetical protein [Rugamonas aquatica]MQA40690.1 hypothetical protein [Rugamonas aquatica]